jgi:hypothetical protein
LNTWDAETTSAIRGAFVKKPTDINLAACFRELATERRSIAESDRASKDRNDREALREQKKNYAEALSRVLAQKVARMLRQDFSGLLPDAKGSGHESRARASRKSKKLDINYSHIEIGLGLGVSIKTLNFRDGASRRYTKNFTRVDNEWRAEASDYHERQPYAVLVGVLFLPQDSVGDGERSHSSFAGAINLFRHRAGRREPSERTELFERIFVALYDPARHDFEDVRFVDATNLCPKNGPPTNVMSFKTLISEISRTYDERNNVRLPWQEMASSDAVTPEELNELQSEQSDEDEIY